MQLQLKNGYASPAAKGKSFDEQHSAQLEKAKLAGKTLGLTNVPGPKEASIEPFIKSIRGFYTGQLSRRAASNDRDISEIENRSSDERSQRIMGKRTETKDKLRRELLERAEMDEDDARHQSTFFIWVGIVLVAAVESIFSYKAFSMLDVGNNFALIVLLLALTAVFIGLPKMLKWWYEQYIVDSPYRSLLRFVPVIGVGIGFFVLGVLRSKYLAAEGGMSFGDNPGSSGFTVSPLYFMGISAFLLMVSYYLAHQLPTNQQKQNRAAIDRKEAAIARLEQELERMDAELSAIPDRQKNSLIRASNNDASRRDSYMQINNHFKQAVGVFMEANLTYRNDGQRPGCFDAPIPDLDDQSA